MRSPASCASGVAAFEAAIDTWPAQILPNFQLSIDAAGITFTLDGIAIGRGRDRRRQRDAITPPRFAPSFPTATYDPHMNVGDF